MNLDRYALRVSPLSGNIYIARMSKDRTLALETRDALQEFIVAILDWVGVDSQREIVARDGTEKYVVSVRKVTD